jgi:hypothetical protein
MTRSRSLDEETIEEVTQPAVEALQALPPGTACDA